MEKAGIHANYLLVGKGEYMPKMFHDEEVKLMFEHTKHITTLSAGSIVAIVTFYEKLGAQKDWKILIAVSLMSFVISIVSGLLAQIGTIDAFKLEDNEKDIPTAISFAACWGFFSIAMISLCIYGVKNL